MYTTKFTIEDYLAEYLRGKWGIKSDSEETNTIVKIPENVYLYDMLSSLTKKRPKHVPETNGNVEIIIPHRKEGNKKPLLHNYISYQGASIFNKRVKLYFRADLHEYMDFMKHDQGISYKEAAYMFINKYAIESFDPESIIKNYSRWKTKVRMRKKTYTTR